MIEAGDSKGRLSAVVAETAESETVTVNIDGSADIEFATNALATALSIVAAVAVAVGNGAGRLSSLGEDDVAGFSWAGFSSEP